jgi:hypothetical protein
MKILAVFVMASLALPALAANKTCKLSAAAQGRHSVAPLNDEISYRGLDARYAKLTAPTAYDAKNNILEIGFMQTTCDGGALECTPREQVTSLEDSDTYQVLGNDDCTTKFIDISTKEDRGADGESADSDLEIQEALQGFKIQSQETCDILNKAPSQIQIENKSTTSGFFFGTGERVHLEFNARCIIQD